MTTTPTLREAAQQALEALEHATTIIDGAIYCGHELNEAGIKKRAAINFRITALRAALAEQAAEEVPNGCPYPRKCQFHGCVGECQAAPAAEQAEPVAVPAGYALVPVDRLKSAAAQAKVAADCIVGFAKDKPGKMCGWLDDACTAADTAAEMFSSILAAPPAPARQEWHPPTDSQLEQLFDAAHEHGQFGREFLEHARTILAAHGEQTKE